MPVHYVTQIVSIFLDKCHICLTRIPIQRKAGTVLVIPIYCVTTETCNCNICVKKIAVKHYYEMEGIQLHICVKIFRLFIYPACVAQAGGICDWGWCPYVDRYMCLWTKKFESYFSDGQIFTVGLLIEFID